MNSPQIIAQSNALRRKEREAVLQFDKLQTEKEEIAVGHIPPRTQADTTTS